MLGRAAAASLILALLLAPGPYSGPAMSSEVSVDDRAAVQALLDRRAEALLAGDRSGFLGTVWQGSKGFRQQQRRLYDALHGGLGLTAYELTADWSSYGDLATPSVAARYPGVASVALPLTRERFRLGELDVDPVDQDQYLTFVKDGEEWFVAADDDLEEAGLFSQRNLWDFGPVRLDESDAFVLLMPACRADCVASPEVILPAAEEAVRRLIRYWSQPWEGRIALVAAGSHEQLADILQATYPVDNYVAFAFWTGEGRAAGPRVILNPRAFTGVSSARAMSVLTHELVHVVSVQHTGPFMPPFIDEGLAQFIQYGGDAAVIAASSQISQADPTLPDDHDFFVGTRTSILNAYRTSLSVVGYLAGEHGYQKVQQFYRRLGRAGEAMGTARYHLDRALQRTFGVGTRSLEHRWASSIGAI